MARPVKKALDYFRKDVDYYDDEKIINLLEEYGPLGQTIYDVILTYVYKNGYYLVIPENTLASLVVRVIGNRWIKNKSLVLQVIDYCADIGLFDKDLLRQNIITSVGIQRRYSDVTARNKVDKSKYWLLEKDDGHAALLSDAENGVIEAETKVSVTKTHVNDTEMQQSKINKNKGNENSVCAGTPEIFGAHGCVRLTDTQHTELINKYGKKVIEDYISRIDEYVFGSGKNPYSNHYTTIVRWIAEDALKGKTSKSKKKHAVDTDPSFDISKLMEE